VQKAQLLIQGHLLHDEIRALFWSEAGIHPWPISILSNKRRRCGDGTGGGDDY
jgi:hypothetical protein